MKNPYSYTENEMGEDPKEPKCTCKEHDPYCCQVHGICPTCVKKEEPKQECRITKIMQMDAKMAYDLLPKQEILLEDVFNEEKKKGVKELIDNHKQETLEEAAEQFEYTNGIYGFKQGAKWQEQQLKDVYLDGYVDGSRAQAKLMYNEEEVKNLLNKRMLSVGIFSSEEATDIWFKQYTKTY